MCRMSRLMTRSNEHDAKRFTDLLFPDIPRLGPYEPRGPRDFWAWQQEYAEAVNKQLHPGRDVAREKWAARCSRDGRLVAAVDRLADAYAHYVRLAVRGWTGG